MRESRDAISRPRYRVKSSDLFKTSFIAEGTGVDSSNTNLVEDNNIGLRPRFQSMSDVVTPSARLLIKSGNILNNPMSSRKVTVEWDGKTTSSRLTRTLGSDGPITTGTQQWEMERWYSQYYFTVSGGFLPAPTTVVDESTLTNRLLASVNKTEWDATAFAGELKETLRLHRDLCNVLKGFLPSVYRAYYRKRYWIRKVPLYDDNGRPLLNSKGRPRYKYIHEKIEKYTPIRDPVAPAWMVARFGIRPLVADISNMLSLLNKNRGIRSRSSVKSSDSKVNQDRVLQSNGGVPVFIDRTTHLYSEISYGCLYETSFSMQLLSSLGLTRPLTSAWELTRLSWLVDYVVDVGTWLDAMQPSGAVAKAVWRKQHLILTETLMVSANDSVPLPYGGHYAVMANERIVRSTDEVIRTPLAGLPPVQVPKIRNDQTWPKAIDAAIVVKQLFRRYFS